MKHKVLRMLTAMAVTLLASVAVMACPVSFAWGEEITITSSTKTWFDGNKYIAKGELTFGESAGRIEVTGNVTLLLEDECFLTVEKGIHINKNSTLIIEGVGDSKDSDKMGQLQVFNRANNFNNANAGIGSNASEKENNGKLIIKGASVKATTSYGASGIGSGNGGTFGAIEVSGGKVDAYGTSGGAGIGKGKDGSCESVTITGGVVVERASEGNSSGAGIAAGRVTISGGFVKTEKGNQSSWGIDGTFSTGEDGNAIIFTESICDKSGISAWRGIVFQGDTGTMYGSNVTPTESFTIDSGKTLTIGNGQKLTIGSGKTLTVEGTIQVVDGASIAGDGLICIIGNGLLSGPGARLIILEPNGGTLADSSMQKFYTSSIEASKLQVSRTWYTFDGWFDNKSFDEGDAVTTMTPGATGDKTYYAKWTPVSHSITYELDGGANNSANPPSYTIEDAVDLLPATKTGYTFKGWFDENSNKVETIALGSTGEKKLKAKWAPNNYTVHFDANGGKGAMADQAFTYDSAQALNANAFTRSCYYFAGWKDEATGITYADGEQVQNLTAEADGTVTLKAQWSYIPQPISIKFVTNCDDGIEPLKGTEGYSIKDRKLPDVSKTGYVFAGWYANACFTGEALEQLPASFPYGGATYYAKWDPIVYTVHFDANGGEGSMQDQNFTFDVTQKLSASTFAKDGYVFAGWKDASFGKTYADAQELSNLTTAAGEVVKLTAQWVPATYTVRFDANGGEGSMADQAFIYDAAQAFNSCAFTRTGYKFAGWLDEATGKTYANGKEVQNLTSASNGSVVLKALWARTAPGDTVSIDTGSGRIGFAVTRAANENGKGGTLALAVCSGCTGKLSIPANVEVDGVMYAVTAIEAKAFKNCAQLTKVVVPASATKIGKEAFAGCKKLRSVVIGKNVKAIGAGAFKGCKNLKTITICSKKLSRKSIKNSLKGSKVAKVVVKVSSAKANKSCAAKYAKLFTKKICGKKVKVIASKKTLK